MIDTDKLEKIRRLRISSSQAAVSHLAGQYRSVFRGRGIEFDEVREYHSGDEVRDIDWNVTARTGRAYIKRYIEERLLSVVLLVDLSASQRIGGKHEAVAQLGALLAAIAIGGGDRVGLVGFTDQIETVLPAARGPQQLDRVIRELLYIDRDDCKRLNRNQEPGRGTDIAAGIEGLNRLGSRPGTSNARSIVFLISDFQDEGYQQQLRLCALQNDVIAIRLNDPVELDMPALGCVKLQDNETGHSILFDTSDPALRLNLGQSIAKQRATTESILKQCRVDLIDMTCADSAHYVKQLDIFFRNRMTRGG